MAAPLLYVSGEQSTAIAPQSMAGNASVDVQVEYQGERTPAVSMPVLVSRPGVFSLDGSGRGPAVAINADGTVNSPSNPAAQRSIMSIYATAGGPTNTGLADD